MTRKEFIQRSNATCKNWSWSWSFINKTEKTIIFGAWDFAETGKECMILSHDWKFSDKNRKNAGYTQSIEHIRLIENEGYKLKTFPIYHSDDKKDEKGHGPARISGFAPKLEDRILIKKNNAYFAAKKSSLTNIPEEVEQPDSYTEGSTTKISINKYERNPKARMKCLDYYGYTCQVCEFDFEKVYGDLGKNYIHVHHLVPLSEVRITYVVDPIKDLIPVCPNCHAIIHRTSPCLSIETLQENIK